VPLIPQTLVLGEFLAALIQSLTNEGLRPCILRNYEGFPDSNVGSDVDFLIHRSDLPRVIRALKSLHCIRVVGYAERHSGAHVFVEGVSPAQGIRALELDFIWSFNWKGLEYISTESVLQAAMWRQAGDLTFLVPSPVHEAIISLLSSLLIGGWLKEKYFAKVQQSFAGDSFKVTAALSPSFGNEAATRLARSVIEGDRQRILSCVRPLRSSLVRRSLLHKPLRSALSSARYHMLEFAVRCTPATLETVCISGCDSRARATIIEGLIPMLRNSAKIVERRQIDFGLFQPQVSMEKAIAESDIEERNSPSVSMTRILKLLVEEWIGQFKKRDNLTLRIGMRSYHDPSFDLQKNRLRFLRSFAKVIGYLLPAVDLLIVLDGTEQSMPSASCQAPPVAVTRRNETELDFVKARERRVILKACRPSLSVVEEAYAAIVDALVRRTESKLRSRFTFR